MRRYELSSLVRCSSKTKINPTKSKICLTPICFRNTLFVFNLKFLPSAPYGLRMSLRKKIFLMATFQTFMSFPFQHFCSDFILLSVAPNFNLQIPTFSSSFLFQSKIRTSIAHLQDNQTLVWCSWCWDVSGSHPRPFSPDLHACSYHRSLPLPTHTRPFFLLKKEISVIVL